MKLPPMLEARLVGFTATKVTHGESGAKVYRFSKLKHRDFYLKHGVGRVAREMVGEAARLAWLNDHLPSPRIQHFSWDGTRAWLLTAALPGRTAQECLVQNPESRTAIVREMAEFLRRLHELPWESCPFEAGHRMRMADARRNIDAGVVDESDFDEARQGWSADQVWHRLCEIVPRGFDRVVTHGDYSTDNIYLDRGKVAGVIDAGRLGVADPYQDLAILWNNLGEFGAELQRALLKFYGVKRLDRRKLEFHLCLDELF
ncbi:MAG: aminoglycoside 3'-phosphotransferase [Bryobacter sp.]|jgi:aminoglycoside 3'-phosphotransferase-1|nr:aminoglycoside 3'-phosphotransferase [Bryobacter sp.]